MTRPAVDNQKHQTLKLRRLRIDTYMDPRAVLELVGRPEVSKIASEVRSRLQRVLAAV